MKNYLYLLVLIILSTSCTKDEEGVEIFRITANYFNLEYFDDTIGEGTPDPYIAVELDGVRIYTTDYFQAGEAPLVWDVQIRLSSSDVDKIVTFKIYDDDNGGDDFMGSVNWRPSDDRNSSSRTLTGDSNSLKIDFDWYDE